MSEAARIDLVDRAPLTEKQQNVYESIMQYQRVNGYAPTIREICKMVQFIPAKLKVIDHYRETYECRSCRKNGTSYMEKAPVPYPPVLHSLASASTITWLIH